MSLAITVRDYRGCERADISASPLALIAGLNGAGKTSIIDAAAAALTNVPLPTQVKKKDAKSLVRNGMDEARVTITFPGQAATVSWPKCDLGSTGRPIRCSIYAAGLASVVELSEKERRQVLAEYLQAIPDQKDLANALSDIHVDKKAIDAIWSKIQVDGWDLTHGVYRDSGARKKGAWEQVTGENFGSRKAADWTPQGFTEDLAHETPESLQKALEDARATCEEAIKAAAVNEEEIRRLKALAAQEPKLKTAVEARKSEVDRLWNTAKKLEAEYKALPAPPTATEHPKCPHCDEAVAVTGLGGGRYKLVKPDQLNPKKIDEMRKALEAKKVELDAALSDHAKAQSNLHGAEADHQSALAAIRDLGPDVENAGEAKSDADIEALRAKVAEAEKRQEMFNARATASKLAAEIVRITEIAAVLGPDGLRKRKMVRAVGSFNTGALGKIAEGTGWAKVTLTEDLDPEYDGRPYALVSRAEKQMVRIALQIAMAEIDQSQAILIDDADTIDPLKRNGLFELLQGLTVPVVVGMMAGHPSKVPDLKAAGMGETYWVEDGEAQPLSAPPAEQQAAE